MNTTSNPTLENIQALIAGKNKRFVIDVTTLIKWRRPPVGIVRTLYEVGKWFYTQKIIEDVVFVRFSDDKTQLKMLEPKELFFLFNNDQSAHYGLNEIRTDTAHLSCQHQMIAKLKAWIKPTKVGKAILLYKRNGFLAVLNRIMVLYFTRLHSYFHTLKLSKRIRNDELSCLFNTAAYAGFFYDTLLKKNDIFISIGLDWDYSNYELLYYFKKTHGFKFIGICYDLIPLSHPQFVVSKLFPEFFLKHIYYLNYLADGISCISHFTEKSLMTFNKENVIKTNTKIKTLYIGDDINHPVNSIENDFIANLPQNFILYVSTIEARKNHLILLQAYLLAHEQNIDLPPLVLVGMYGWGMDTFDALYEKNPWLKDKIKIYHEVNDENLHQLYQEALFCVFPSHVEGWGLGAAESLMYKKMCIISNADALKEATRGLMPSVDANDAQQWLSQMHYFTSNPIAREKIEQHIQDHFIPKPWVAFCEEFYQFSKEASL